MKEFGRICALRYSQVHRYIPSSLVAPDYDTCMVAPGLAPRLVLAAGGRGARGGKES